jgi:hypothetical protein
MTLNCVYVAAAGDSTAAAAPHCVNSSTESAKLSAAHVLHVIGHVTRRRHLGIAGSVGDTSTSSRVQHQQQGKIDVRRRADLTARIGFASDKQSYSVMTFKVNTTSSDSFMVEVPLPTPSRSPTADQRSVESKLTVDVCWTSADEAGHAGAAATAGGRGAVAGRNGGGAERGCNSLTIYAPSASAVPAADAALPTASGVYDGDDTAACGGSRRVVLAVGVSPEQDGIEYAAYVDGCSGDGSEKLQRKVEPSKTDAATGAVGVKSGSDVTTAGNQIIRRLRRRSLDLVGEPDVTSEQHRRSNDVNSQRLFDRIKADGSYRNSDTDNDQSVPDGKEDNTEEERLRSLAGQGQSSSFDDRLSSSTLNSNEVDEEDAEADNEDAAMEERSRRKWAKASGMAWIKRGPRTDVDDRVMAAVAPGPDGDTAAWKRRWERTGMSWIKRSLANSGRRWEKSGMGWIKRGGNGEEETAGQLNDWVGRDDDGAATDGVGRESAAKRRWAKAGMSWIK